MIELRPEKEAYYRELHAASWPAVQDMISKCHIRNYSVFLAPLAGKLYLFSYFEYIGSDLEADMAKMAEDQEAQRWWEETDPCQKRIGGTPEKHQCPP